MSTSARARNSEQKVFRSSCFSLLTLFAKALDCTEGTQEAPGGLVTEITSVFCRYFVGDYVGLPRHTVRPPLGVVCTLDSG